MGIASSPTPPAKYTARQRAVLLAATTYYHERGEDLTQKQLIDRLAEEMFIPEPRKSSFEKQEEPQAEAEPASLTWNSNITITTNY